MHCAERVPLAPPQGASIAAGLASKETAPMTTRRDLLTAAPVAESPAVDSINDTRGPSSAINPFAAASLNPASVAPARFDFKS